VCGIGRGPSLIALWEGAVPCPLLQNFRFLNLIRRIFVDCLALNQRMQCMVVDGGRVIIRSKPFIASEVMN